MPAPQEPSQPDGPAAEAALIGLYAWAAVELLRRLWVILADTPHTLAGMQAAVGPMRRALGPVLAALQVRTQPLLDRMVDGYTAAGRALAVQQVAAVQGGHYTATPVPTVPAGPRLTGDSPPPPGAHPGPGVEDRPDWFDLAQPHGERAADAIRADMAHSLGQARERITRLPDDVYKAIAPHGAIRQVLDNGWTPRQSQAAAWRVFLAHGVTGFTDRAGKRWNLATYTEMAVRTAAMRAFNDSHLAALRALGLRYFTVHEHATACPACWPWEGQILSDGLQPDDPAIPVAGTLNDAIAAGLFHPNCRHALQPWFPSVSPVPSPRPPWGEQQQQQYDDSQRQRAIERAIRKAKQEQDLALDATERRRAGRRVRALQATMRAHLDGKPHLSRLSHREQPDLGYARVRLPAATSAADAPPPPGGPLVLAG